MPFREGGYCFAINNANMYDAKGNPHQPPTQTTQGEYRGCYSSYPCVDPWALSVHQIATYRRAAHTIQSIDDVPDPDVEGWPIYTSSSPAQPGSAGLLTLSPSDIGDAQTQNDLWEDVHIFLVDVLLRQLYLYLLFRLPSPYFSRVYRVFKDPDLSLAEIKDMGLRVAAEDMKALQVRMANLKQDPRPPELLPPVYAKLKERWEALIDGLLKEWKTLNIISGLLVTGILTVLQIPSALDDCYSTPKIRKAYVAAEWALVGMFMRRFAQLILFLLWDILKYRSFFWNIGVMLAMPVVWITWSISTFIACIVCFMWRFKRDSSGEAMSFVAPGTELGFRIFISAVLVIGLIYGILIFIALQRYGEEMDRAWSERADRVLMEQAERRPMKSTHADFGYLPSSTTSLAILTPENVAMSTAIGGHNLGLCRQWTMSPDEAQAQSPYSTPV